MPLTGWLLWFILLPLAANQSATWPVELTTAQSPSVGGELVRIESGAVIFRNSGKQQVIPTSEILSVKFKSSVKLDSDASSNWLGVQVELVDGSRFSCNSIRSDGEQLAVNFAERRFQLPTQAALSMQLRELSEEETKGWRAISQSAVNSDVLVLYQATGTLTKIEGVVLGIEEEKVQFEFSGQKIDVPFSKLAGIRFFVSDNSERPRISAVVTDIHANTWITTALNSDPSGNALTLSLQCGAEESIPMSELAEIDFSYGSLKYVADLEPIRRVATPLFDFGIPEEAELFGARRVASQNAPGRAVGPSIEFLGSGEAVYRIPAGFSRLSGSVELRPRGKKFTPCTVQIYLESKLLWEQNLSQTRTPFQYEVAVEGDERLRLVVSTKSKVPTGDVVVWQEPKFLK